MKDDDAVHVACAAADATSPALISLWQWFELGRALCEIYAALLSLPRDGDVAAETVLTLS